ncbi:MAG: hypothetical protein OHK0039_30890 [Bacteroidia bacterium]
MTSATPDKSQSLAYIHPQAKVHPSARIEPFAVIHEDVEIGANTYIGSHVVLYKGVRIGEHCRIMPGTVISADARQLEFWRAAEETQGSLSVVRIGNHVHIESSASIHGGVVIEDHCWLGSSCTIHDGARIGRYCKIFPGAVVSAIPQDLKFHGEKTTLEIGEHTIVREFATLNRGTDYHGKTVIGRNVLIMAYVHIAHDCLIGDNVILVNNVNMGGHVEIEDYAVIGGVSAIHQFVKIGKHAMVAGGSLVRKDVPPYAKAGRTPLQYEGVNSIGLRRRGFSNDTIHLIQEIYRTIFLSGMNTSSALDYVEAHLPATEERDEIITFIRKASRGIIRGHHGSEEKTELD